MKRVIPCVLSVSTLTNRKFALNAIRGINGGSFLKQFRSLLDKNRWLFLVTLLVGIVFSAIGVAVPTISGKLISTIITDSGKRSIWLYIFLFTGFTQICFAELDEYTGGLLKIKQKSLMRKKSFEAFSTHDNSTREDISSFVSFVNNDIPSIVEQYISGTIDILKCVSIILLSALTLFYIHWSLAATIIGVSLLIVLLPNSLRARGSAARKKYSAKLANYNTVLQSILDGISLMKAYQCQSYGLHSVNSANREIAGSEKTLLKHQLIIQGITTVLQVGKTVMILIIGIHLVSKRIIDIGSLIAVIQLAEVIGAPIEVLAYLRHSRNEVQPILEQYIHLTGKTVTPKSRKIHCSESFSRLDVEHVTYNSPHGYKILADVTASFQAGGKYLITGKSGSGKTTLLRLISQIGDTNYTGQISINQTEIREITFESLYKILCPVFQEPYLFYATLEENIYLGRSIPRNLYDDIISKLDLAYLLDRYHGKEITPEIIETLSGGERQRIALARAMVGQPKVYLLDEVTSALDPKNAELVENLLLHEDAAIIHICHKPNPDLITHYDVIYEMANGVLSNNRTSVNPSNDTH